MYTAITNSMFAILTVYGGDWGKNVWKSLFVEGDNEKNVEKNRSK